MINYNNIFKGLIALSLFSIVSCKHTIEMELSNTPTYSDVCSPDTVYFVNDILPIINSNCAYSGCHGGGSSKDGVDLSNYISIIQTGEIDQFNPGNSELYEVITETDPDKIMPPPPSNALSQDQINKIYTWINQGAKNNECASQASCDTTNVGFAADINPIIQNKCTGCHSGGSPSGNVSLSTYAQISASANNGSLYGTVNHEQGYVPMPYGQSKMPQCEIDMIKKWIDEGAQNN